MTQAAEILSALPWNSIIVGLTGGAVLWFGFRLLMRRTGGFNQDPNWRFLLLVATCIALSLASGWTTWEGMRNFTSEPLLSLLITFGIQAILLVVSWLIGESFANSPGHEAPALSGHGGAGQSIAQALRWTGGVVATASAAILIWGLFQPQATDLAGAAWLLTPDVTKAAWLALALSLAAVALAESGRIFAGQTVWAMRTIFTNLTLWVMFAACLVASVFFSFNSLFSNIFPAGERQRAAELHTRARVAQLTADVRDTAIARLDSERSAMLASPAWRQYDERLERLVTSAGNAPEVIRKRASSRLRERQTEISAFRSEQAAAAVILERLARTMKAAQDDLEEHRRKLAELAQAQSAISVQIGAIDKEMAAKALEAEQEERGLAASAIAGRGPNYRAIIKAQQLLDFERRKRASELKLLEDETDRQNERIARAEAAYITVSRNMAKQRAKTDMAKRLRSLSGGGTGGNDDNGVTAETVTQGVTRLRASRADFLQAPTRGSLDALSRNCTQLVTALSDVPNFAGTTSNPTCTSANLHASTLRLDTVATAITRLTQSCTSKDSVPENVAVDTLVSFARNCISIAGLPATETAALQNDVNRIALKRDDKAHRFVVTMNAFEDGNQLAYLALAIALAIDGLVFAAGLFGAYAARSPLSAIQTNHGRSGRQIEAVVASALLPDIAGNARQVLEHASPAAIARRSGVERHWTHTIDTARLLPSVRRTIAKLLAAGAAVGAVRQDPDNPDQHALRRELVEYLALAARVADTTGSNRERTADLTAALVTTLSPGAEEKAARIRHYFTPMPRDDGYMAAIDLDDVEADDRLTVRLTLTSAAAMDCVKADKADAKGEGDGGPDTSITGRKFLVHKDLYQALAALHAAHLAEQSPATAEPAAKPAQAPAATVSPSETTHPKSDAPALRMAQSDAGDLADDAATSDSPTLPATNPESSVFSLEPATGTFRRDADPAPAPSVPPARHARTGPTAVQARKHQPPQDPGRKPDPTTYSTAVASTSIPLDASASSGALQIQSRPIVKLTKTATPAAAPRPAANRPEPLPHLFTCLRAVVPIPQQLAIPGQVVHAAGTIWHDLLALTQNDAKVHAGLTEKWSAAIAHLDAARAELEATSNQVRIAAIHNAYERVTKALPVLLLQSSRGVLDDVKERLAGSSIELRPLHELLCTVPDLEPDAAQPWLDLARQLTALRHSGEGMERELSMELGLDVNELADVMGFGPTQKGGPKGRP